MSPARQAGGVCAVPSGAELYPSRGRVWLGDLDAGDLGQLLPGEGDVVARVLERAEDVATVNAAGRAAIHSAEG